MSRICLAVAFGLGAFGAACAPSATPTPAEGGFLVTNAVVIDGTGAPPRRAAVRVEGDRIAAVGDLTHRPGETTIDARGLALAPGFIDTHSHADGALDDRPDALAVVSQGITTIIGGQDGGSSLPLASFFAALDKSPAAVNVGMYAGHGSIRDSVMGEDFKRAATGTEVARMSAILAGEMRAGALGLSTGLEYDPGIYSERAEVIALAKVSASFGGRYISHIRSEDYAFWQAIDEIIAIGREAKLPVQVSHAKLAMRSLWGRADSLIALLDAARAQGVDITADIYPYLYWHSTLTVLFPKRDFENRQAAEFALTETSTPGGLLLGRYDPNPAYAGKTIAEISALRGTDSVTTLIELIRESEAMRKATGRSTQSVIGTSMVEADVERIMKWPHTNLSTDGALNGPHPRGFGAFPRFLGLYVRERKVMSLEEAVRRMTSLAAAHVGISDRGRIAPGMFADLVLFDPATVIDRATPREPHVTSVGIERVWVNGVIVYSTGATSGARPGRVLRRR
ncbi:MAG: D-aminoacylase domain protein [Geminicoccaceae bacterium]|nr:D-aminoacylase domain protein [Geminicoccaceae bacterium]